MNRISICTLVALVVFFTLITPLHAEETVIAIDTRWSGDIAVTDDVLILKGATLTIAAGTVVHVSASESTKTDPEYISSYTEITVRGALNAEGTADKPITFFMEDHGQDNEWAGIIVDTGTAKLTWCRISGADSGLTVIKGMVEVGYSNFSKNRYAISVLDPAAQVAIANTVLADNDYGLVLMNGADVSKNQLEFSNSKQQDFLKIAAPAYTPEKVIYSVAEKVKNAPYQSESMLGTVVWKDRVTINGIIRIPPTSRLIIMPGTIVEFTKRDTNADGIGENGLLVMGMLIAKGTKENPIIFRSAEKNRKMGDWDAINIYTSDGFQNLLEYVQVEDAYRGLHVHFTNVLLNHAVLRGNYRGMQFQESTVVVKNSDIYDNNNAMRARDSEITFVNNRIFSNYSGPNIFRITGLVKDNIFANNYYDGLRVREGALDVEHNAMYGNRYGLTVAYANFGAFGTNVLMHNQEAGLILKGTDNIKVAGNFIQANGGNGISLLRARADIVGNQITYNGERGIGIISFAGKISANNILNNALYAMGLDGDNDIAAEGNFWGEDADMAKIIYDHADEARLGRVSFAPVLTKPVAFTWPVSDVMTDTIWQGEIDITHRVDTRAGSNLIILPATTVRFADKRGMWANGNISAIGLADKRILFSGLHEKWHQIRVEKAQSAFVNCDFQQAETALHTHFSKVMVRNCSFANNETGMMFKGGPVEISSSSFTSNSFGLVFNKANGEVFDSAITNNEVGIMVRAQEGEGIRVAKNNIYANSRYNLKMGDFNNGQDIDVRDNWWGGESPVSSIFDDNIEAGIGRAVFMPFAEKRFAVRSSELKVNN